ISYYFFFFQAEDGIRDFHVTGVQTCALPIYPVAVDPAVVDFDAAMLPPKQSLGVNVVNMNLRNFNAYNRIDNSQIKNIDYRPKFKLDYLANSGVGMSVGSRYGAGIASGIQGMFSDILGYNQIFAALNINGEIYDF